MGMYSGQVSQSSDDAEQLNSSDDVDLTDTTLHLKDKWSDYVGVRFQNVTVPAGATITSATLTWELVVAPISASNSIQIYGELSVNSATFQVNQYDISNRTRTSQYTRWDVPDILGLIASRPTPVAIPPAPTWVRSFRRLSINLAGRAEMRFHSSLTRTTAAKMPNSTRTMGAR